jgi:hypothetical protein
MTRTADDNAIEFGALARQGKNVRLALLVACSVDKGSGNGRPPKGTGATAPLSVKVSARDFGRRAETTKDRVARHLAAWDRMAARE